MSRVGSISNHYSIAIKEIYKLRYYYEFRKELELTGEITKKRLALSAEDLMLILK